MLNEIEVSVVIPVYNGAELIQRCIQSVLNQKTARKIEIILVDDGSTDTTIQIVRNNFPGVVIYQQSNGGPSAARNRGMRMSRGKYIALLDGDDYWLPDFIEATVCYLEKHPLSVIVNVAQKHISVGGEHTVPYDLQKIADNCEYIELPCFYDFWAKHDHAYTSSVVLRKSAFNEAGGFDESLRLCEDLEYWAYIATFGKWGFIPSVLVVSDGGQVTATQGWLAKCLRRWHSAPALEVWEHRIIPRIKGGQMSSYLDARAKIVGKILCYAMIQSGRFTQAYYQYKKHGNLYPKDKITSLMRFCSISKVSWFFLSLMLCIRERCRVVRRK